MDPRMEREPVAQVVFTLPATITIIIIIMSLSTI